MTTRSPSGADGQPPAAKPKVFISYAREDSKLVRRLEGDLERDGFDVWTDRGRIRVGDAFAEEIARAIQEADFFLVIVSRSSNQSSWVQDEINTAVTSKNNVGRPKVVPLRRRNSQIPPSLVGKHYEQFGFGSYQRSYEALISELRELPRPLERPSKKVIVAAAAAVLLVVGLALWMWLKPRPGLRTIVVPSFINTTRQVTDNWISTALADLLTAALRAGGEARVVDREEVTAAERDFVLLGKPADFGRRLGADYVIAGSFERPVPDLAPLRVYWSFAAADARGDPSLREKKGSLDKLVSLTLDLADDVRTRVGLPALSGQQRSELKALFPQRPKALALYFAGLTSYRAFDPPTAFRQLTAARTEEPDQPLIYRRLASVAWSLRRDTEAIQLAGLARQHARDLSPRERLEIETLQPKMLGQWGEVRRQYETLRTAAPEEYSYRFELADAQISEGARPKAMETLNALLNERPRPPRYVQAKAAYQLADLADDLGQPEAALERVDRAVEAAQESAAAYLLAEAQFLRSQILSGLGRHTLAEPDLDAAERTFRRANKRSYVLACAEQRAILQFDQGSRPLSAILEDLRRLETIYRDQGALEELERVLALESAVLTAQGDTQAAAQLREATGKESRDVVVSTLIERAGALLVRGDVEGAERTAAAASTVATESASSAKTRTAFTLLAESFYYRGNLEKAESLQKPWGHSESLAAYDKYILGMILAAQGKPEGRATVEEAYRSQIDIAESASQAETAVGLARLDNLAGDFKPAAALASKAEAVLRRAGRADLVALAQATWAWALTCQGDTSMAGKVLEAAKRRAQASTDFRVRFETAVSAARFQALTGNPRVEAVHILEALAQEAHAKGLGFYELDARLALGEIKMALAGDSTELKRLATDAARSGFGQTAQLAEKVLQEGPICTALRPGQNP